VNQDKNNSGTLIGSSIASECIHEAMLLRLSSECIHEAMNELPTSDWLSHFIFYGADASCTDG
jgi:hypothetical protein